MVEVRVALATQMCGWTVARAHARSGDRAATASNLGSGDAFDRAIADFAVLVCRSESARSSSTGGRYRHGSIQADLGI